MSEVGSMAMQLSERNGGWEITLDWVLYVPGLDDNLLSVARIEEKGLNVMFKGCRATVTNNETKVTKFLRHLV